MSVCSKTLHAQGRSAPRRFSRALPWFVAVPLLLSACASPQFTPAPPVQPSPAPMPGVQPAPTPERQPEMAAFSARLRGAETVPPSNSPAQGELVAVLNRNTGLLQWKLSYTGLSSPVRSAQFHSPGMSGEVAPAVLSLGNVAFSPVEGRAMLTQRQRQDLLAGQWYINISTARFPEGELRGQLIEQN